ncbi:MAG: phosphatidylglycerol lysyltransferase domain-containing protein [Bacillota bacterium]
MTFREIEISDKQLFESKVNEDMFCENCCGYERVFQVLYCFSKQYNYKMAIDNGTIYVMFNHEGNIGFFPPIVKHPHEFLPAFEKLVKYCEKSDIQLKIYGIDKVKIDIIASARKYMFYASSDRNTFEYLYRPEKLINMGDYSLQKRNMLKSFEKRFKSELREYQEEDRAEVIGLLKEWSETKGEEEGDINAMVLALDNIKALDLFCDVLIVKDKIVGIDIGYKARDIGIIMYEKVSKKIFGAGVKIVQEFSKKRFADCKYINRQEDMGDTGLRNSKLSYKQDKFIIKYKFVLL